TPPDELVTTTVGEYDPVAVGVHVKTPVVELMLIPVGNVPADKLHVRLRFAGSVAVNVKLYCWVTLARAGGVPEVITGGFTAGFCTTIWYDWYWYSTFRSSTTCTVTEYTPVAVGVPLISPVFRSIDSQLGPTNP